MCARDDDPTQAVSTIPTQDNPDANYRYPLRASALSFSTYDNGRGAKQSMTLVLTYLYNEIIGDTRNRRKNFHELPA